MAKPQYQKDYEKRAVKQYRFELNKNTDADIIAFLETVDNKQGTIKRLLREEIERKKRG
ncbi:MAG: hypothetical protein ACLSU9_11085 [Anaerovoracaceae bacterium]